MENQNAIQKTKSKKNKSSIMKTTGRKTPKGRSITQKYSSKNPYPITNQLRSSIVRAFLQLLNLVKLYHWKTHVFSQHEATDNLYKSLNDHIDKFIEVLLGKSESRIQIMEKKIQLFDSKNKTEFKQHIYNYREFLIDMNNYFHSTRDSDLLNIRDEILGDINQFLYLMTFH